MATPLLWMQLHEVAPPDPPVVEEGATLVIDRDALADVDLRLVHTELVPDWVVARGGVKQSHWHRLRREAGRDVNLGALLDRVDELVQLGPAQHARELFTLLGAWNTYLAKGGQPWRVAGEIVPDSEGGTLRLKTYEVIVDDAVVTVGDRAYPVSVRRRVDATTQLDTWLGHVHSHEEGVVLLLDELVGFSLDRVWPMLDPVLDGELSPLQATFAAAVRRDAAVALEPVHLSILESTAEDRLWLLRAVRSVHARHRCGSQFLVSRLPFEGLSRAQQATVRRHVDPTGDDPCPDVTELEALVFATRSQQLQSQAGLQEALQHLVAWVGRAVTIHEAQHAFDVDLGVLPEWSCEDCPPALGRVGRLEGSAYLASFAHPGSASLSLFQACGLDTALLQERGRVIDYLTAAMGVPGCEVAPSPDVPERAAALQDALMHRRDPIVIRSFPSMLPVIP